MSHGDPAKWHMPGWRIEQRFAKGVLIGNWGEERYTFQKGNQVHNSTHRVDFRNYGSFRPDVVIRRKAQLQNDGLGKEFLFYHHGNRYSNNMISWYDEHYNNRERDEANKLPELRNWNSHKLSWEPEKSDYPIQGSATNFGMLGKLQAKWASQIADETRGDFMTTYTGDYKSCPDAMVRTRYATPKEKSSHMLRMNSTNKDLHFRSMPFLHSPENVPSVKTAPPQAMPQIPQVEAAMT